MSDYLPDLITDLKTAIRAVWSEFATDRTIFTANQSLEFNLLAVANGVMKDYAGASIGFPICVLEIGQMRGTEDWGPEQDRLYYAPVAIWYIDKMQTRAGNVSNEVFISSKLFSLVAKLKDNEYASFLIDNPTSFDASHKTDAATEYFDQQYPLCAGVIWWEKGLLTGELLT